MHALLRAVIVVASLSVPWCFAAEMAVPQDAPSQDFVVGPTSPTRSALMRWQWAGVWSTDCSGRRGERELLHNLVPDDPSLPPSATLVRNDRVVLSGHVVDAVRQPFSGDLWVAVEDDTQAATTITETIWHRHEDHARMLSVYVMISAKQDIPAGVMAALPAGLAAGQSVTYAAVVGGFEVAAAQHRTPQWRQCQAGVRRPRA